MLWRVLWDTVGVQNCVQTGIMEHSQVQECYGGCNENVYGA